MRDMTKLVELLEQKKDAFQRFEDTTNKMLDCKTEELELHLEERAKLIEEIDAIDARVLEFCGAQPGEDNPILDAVRGKSNRGELDDDLGLVYDKSGEVRQIVTRLAETETQVGIRMRVEQQQILALIKSNNRGVGAQAAKFMSQPQQSENGAIHTSKA